MAERLLLPARLISEFLSSTGDALSSLAQGDSTPLRDLFEWAVLAFTRREQAGPTDGPLSADPIQTVYSPTQVLGEIDGFDPDGDQVAYTVIQQPRFGHVEVKPDGTYVYTPTSGVVSEDDSFVVGVDDVVAEAVAVDTAPAADLVEVDELAMVAPPAEDVVALASNSRDDAPISVPVTITAGTPSESLSQRYPSASQGRTPTEGFDVYNLTSQAVTLTGYATDERPDSGPPVGTVIPAMSVAHFEVRYNFFGGASLQPTFQNAARQTTPPGSVSTSCGASRRRAPAPVADCAGLPA